LQVKLTKERREVVTKLHALVAFGANLPLGGQSPAESLRQAAAELAGQGLDVVALSRFFATPCFPAGAGPDYVNAAALVTIPGSDKMGGAADLAAVLETFHAVEAKFGRKRLQRWGMRTMDIDLLAVGDSVLPDAETQDRWRLMPQDQQIGATPDRLILPHPRMQDRAFVLVPLADVAPDWVHPRTGQTVRAMLTALPQADRDAVTPL
jgi:2-amino-4-hydroxy-6-hydroxymethyldihydropteridine diphosphokinase